MPMPSWKYRPYETVDLPDRRWPDGTLGPEFGGGEVPAGARVRALRCVRRGRGLLDFAAGTEALIRQSGGRQPSDRLRIHVKSYGGWLLPSISFVMS